MRKAQSSSSVFNFITDFVIPTACDMWHSTTSHVLGLDFPPFFYIGDTTYGLCRLGILCDSHWLVSEPSLMTAFVGWGRWRWTCPHTLVLWLALWHCRGWRCDLTAFLVVGTWTRSASVIPLWCHRERACVWHASLWQQCVAESDWLVWYGSAISSLCMVDSYWLQFPTIEPGWGLECRWRCTLDDFLIFWCKLILHFWCFSMHWGTLYNTETNWLSLPFPAIETDTEAWRASCWPHFQSHHDRGRPLLHIIKNSFINTAAMWGGKTYVPVDDLWCWTASGLLILCLPLLLYHFLWSHFIPFTSVHLMYDQ